MQNSPKNCPFCNTNDHHIPLQQSETLNLRLKQKETEMKKKEEEIVSLQSQVRVLHTKLRGGARISKRRVQTLGYIK